MNNPIVSCLKCYTEIFNFTEGVNILTTLTLILIESQPTEIAKNEIFFLFRFLRAWSGYVLKFSISPKPLITWSWWNPRFNQKSHFTFRVFLKCTPQTDFFYILWWKFQIKIIHDIINYVHTHVILCLLVVFSIQKNICL